MGCIAIHFDTAVMKQAHLERHPPPLSGKGAEQAIWDTRVCAQG